MSIAIVRLRSAGLAVLAAAALSGCFATRFDTQVTGYTCCNLRTEYGWISSNNVQGQGNLVPLGAPVRLESIKRKYYVYGQIGGIDRALRDDSSSAKGEQDTMRWVHRIVVPDDPAVRLSAWPADVRLAIGAARVFAGMTREQVAMALGYPSTNETPDLDGPIWRYSTSVDDALVELEFSGDGVLKKLSGSPAGLRLVELPR